MGMLQRITLHLARDRQYPQGSAEHGYELIAPLDATGRLDPAAWSNHRNECQVRRFWHGEDDRFGHLVHRAGGTDGATWKFEYGYSDDEEETGFRLDRHTFLPEEYVSIRDDEGHSHTFKVARVRPL